MWKSDVNEWTFNVFYSVSVKHLCALLCVCVCLLVCLHVHIYLWLWGREGEREHVFTHLTSLTGLTLMGVNRLTICEALPANAAIHQGAAESLAQQSCHQSIHSSPQTSISNRLARCVQLHPGSGGGRARRAARSWAPSVGWEWNVDTAAASVTSSARG